MNQKTIKSVAAHFSFSGALANIKELTAGNINVTYRLTYTKDGLPHQYIIQRINTNAFKDPVSLMDNVGKVTSHIRASSQAEGINPDRRVLTFVPCDNGTLLYIDPEGGAWRAYHYVDGVTAYDQIESADLFREAGRGFGEFQTRLSDFPAAELAETIPGFHNTAWRYGAFLRAIEEDTADRVASIPDDIAFFHERKELAHAIVSKLGHPDLLPLRVTHNDTKLNNVLIDNATGKALCVIDLDTVMPGSSLYDYGDAVRYGACTAAEDEPDLSKIDFDMTLFKAFTEGFVSATEGKLTETEIRLLPLGIKVIAYELAMRFLTDYINGDVYFKTNYEGHNLVRARAQMKLLTVVEEKYEEMCVFIEKMLKK